MNIVILTGAGISAESGIETFRDAGGLWENHRIEDVATPEGYARDPDLVQRFYNLRRAALKTVKPNAAHIALAKLEHRLLRQDGSVTLVTQNVDDLHERGGSTDVIHMHGQLTSVFCTACNHRWNHAQDIKTGQICITCKTSDTTRPDIVWFGEMPYHMDRIEAALSSCDLFVSIGTSGAVYPAAGFVQMATAYGAQTLELNLERSQGSHYFDDSQLGPASKIVPQWVDAVLNEN
ncbi:NAD-dependent deacylase [Fretibacter rubidus]|uniref:NAD-dependent deacylase n=1 Tax=Fretibacter rubidus TaxID=570162 RepID=UPI00352A36B6